MLFALIYIWLEIVRFKYVSEVQLRTLKQGVNIILHTRIHILCPDIYNLDFNIYIDVQNIKRSVVCK